jgi:hypothetical protein
VHLIAASQQALGHALAKIAATGQQYAFGHADLPVNRAARVCA